MMTFNNEIDFQEVLDLYPISEATEEDNIQILKIINRLGRIIPGLKIEGDIFKRENGPRIIQNTMNHFNSWKEKIQTDDSADFVGVKHLATISLAKLCFYYWITDSTIVSLVLSHIFDWDGNFSSFFTHIVNRQDSRLTWPSCIPNSKQKEYLPLLYFLSHAHNSKLKFGDTRFIDIKLQTPLLVPPAYLACIYVKPKLLLLTIRYGADVERRKFRGTDDWDINMLLRHLIRTLWSLVGPEYQSTKWEKNVISNKLSYVLECLNILLRAIEQIDTEELDFDLASYIQGNSEKKKSTDFISWLSEIGFVPHFASRYRNPCELQHLCRLVIRKALNKNWNLPHGISSLPLPKILHEYINIARD